MLFAAGVSGPTYSWVVIAGGVLGIVGLVGAAIAYLRSSIASNTITLLKANNEALHEQNNIQQLEIDKLKATVSSQMAQIAMLKDMVMSAERLDTIADRLDVNRKEILDARDAIVQAIRSGTR